MAHAEAQEEPVRVDLGDRVVGHCSVGGGVRPDAHDAGRRDDAPSRAEEIPGELEGAGPVGEPERPVAELLQLGGRVDDLGPLAVELPAPDPDATKLHVYLPAFAAAQET